MEVYFVRHGQTDGNVALRHQHENTDLNEVGKLQADRVGRFLAKKRPTHIITSTDFRAVATAKVIAKYCRLVPETLPVFEELSIPKHLTGKRITSKDSLLFISKWFFGREEEKDGESYADFLERIIRARKILEEMPENSRVVVVSHSVYINFFLEHMCRDKKMSTPKAIKNLVRILTMHNTELFRLEFKNNSIEENEKKKKCNWQLIEKLKKVEKVQLKNKIKEKEGEWDFLEKQKT